MQTEPVALAITLQNLVTNALNFSPAGSEVRVVVGADYLSVEDLAPGIIEAELGRLFERFYSRDNANGAGLGLEREHRCSVLQHSFKLRSSHQTHPR